MALKRNRSLEDQIDNKLDNNEILNEKSNIELKKEIINDNETKQDRMKLYSIRMPEDFANKLEKHFKKKGSNMSNGIRMIIYDFLEKNRLI